MESGKISSIIYFLQYFQQTCLSSPINFVIPLRSTGPIMVITLTELHRHTWWTNWTAYNLNLLLGSLPNRLSKIICAKITSFNHFPSDNKTNYYCIANQYNPLFSSQCTCKRAEFCVSYDLIGSGSTWNFSTLPANLGGILALVAWACVISQH